MDKYPTVNAAFINAIREEGTKQEACDFLQEQWNETCALHNEITRLRSEVDHMASWGVPEGRRMCLSCGKDWPSGKPCYEQNCPAPEGYEGMYACLADMSFGERAQEIKKLRNLERSLRTALATAEADALERAAKVVDAKIPHLFRVAQSQSDSAYSAGWSDGRKHAAAAIRAMKTKE